jgi:hypothetical protein
MLMDGHEVNPVNLSYDLYKYQIRPYHRIWGGPHARGNDMPASLAFYKIDRKTHWSGIADGK